MYIAAERLLQAAMCLSHLLQRNCCLSAVAVSWCAFLWRNEMRNIEKVRMLNSTYFEEGSQMARLVPRFVIRGYYIPRALMICAWSLSIWWLWNTSCIRKPRAWSKYCI